MTEVIEGVGDLSRLELMVLAAIQHLNANGVAGEVHTVSTVLMLVSHLTDLDLECPGIESTQTVEEATNRLEAAGHLAEVDGPVIGPGEDGSFTLVDIPPEIEEQFHAIEFAVAMYTLGTEEQAAALTMMVHFEQSAVEDGWPKDGEISELITLAATILGQDAARMILMGFTLATRSRLEWPHIRAKI